MFNIRKHAKSPKRERKTLRRHVTEGFILAALLLIITAIANKYLPPIAVRLISELTNTQIEAEDVKLRLNGSVLIRNLEIRSNDQKNRDDTILRAGKIYARFSLISLILLRPELKKVSISDFILDIQQDIDSDKWNIASIRLALVKGGVKGKIPEIRLRNGEIRYCRMSKGKAISTMAIPLDMRLRPSKGDRKSYAFDLATARLQGQASRKITGRWKPGRFEFAGSLSSNDVSVLAHTWKVELLVVDYSYQPSGDFELKVRVNDFITEDREAAAAILKGTHVLQQLNTATALAGFMENYRFTGRFDLEMKASGNLNNIADVNIAGVIGCEEVAILYTVFPYFIKNLEGTIEFDHEKILINDLKGDHKGVPLTVGGSFHELGPNLNGQLSIMCKDMPLDEDLYEALWDVQKTLWDDFTPEGKVAFEFVFSLAAKAGTSFGLNVDLINVDSTYKLFPYPLDNLTGNLFFDIESIKVTDLKSTRDDRVVNINGDVTDTNTPNPKFDLVIDVNNVPLDKYLADALPGPQRGLYDMFSPDGFGQGRILVRNDPNDANLADFTADLDFNDTTLHPPMLPLSITDINANGVFTPNSIDFRRFAGLYGGQPVSMIGQFILTPEGNDISYAMTLSSDASQITGDVLDLIPEGFRLVIDKLNPTGEISYSAKLDKQADSDIMGYDVTVDLQNAKSSPTMFDFEFTDMTGRIDVNKEKLVLTDIQTNSTDVNSVGVKLEGRMDFNTSDSNEAGISYAGFNAELSNLPIEGKRIQSLLTHMRYELETDRWVSDNFSGKFYDGILNGKLYVKFEDDEPPLFELQAGYDNADLQKFLADRPQEPNDSPDVNSYSTGSMGGFISVAGRLNQTKTYLGTCRGDITDMQVGKMSFVGNLLSVLKLSEPKDYIFDRLSFDAYIKDGKFLFESIEISGNAITFGGTGWMDMTDKSIDLSLAVRGPRASAIRKDIFESLADAISPGVLQVHISGNVYKPNIEVKILPMFGGAFEVLGTKELQKVQ